jgi:ribose 5-phosphate isomerase A
MHPFAIHIVRKKLKEAGRRPAMRMLREGYPYVTENGNFVLDTSFSFPSDIRRLEVDLKSIAGVIEVGLFTRRVGVYYYYKAKEDGAFGTIENS